MPYDEPALFEAYTTWAPIVLRDKLGERRLQQVSGMSARRARTVIAWVRHGVPEKYADKVVAVAVAEPEPEEWGGYRSGLKLQAIPEDDEAEEPIREVIARQVQRFERAKAKDRTIGVRTVEVADALPIAITHFGDPHVDDDGCDWPALLHTVKVVSETPGMYGGNIGDTVNNWVGRLVKKYADQMATEDEGWRLAGWLMGAVPWLYVVAGNHDMWNKGYRVLKYLKDNAEAEVMAPDEVKVELLWPTGETMRIHARHDFKGHSQWNALHGLMKAANFDGWADVYVAGHRHTWGASQYEYTDGRTRWAVRVRGFKRFDDYARAKGFHEQKHGESVTTVLNPYASNPAGRVRTFVDVDEAAEYLTWLRARHGEEA